MLKSCGELSIAEVDADVQRHLEAKDWGSALDTVRDTVDSVINNRRSVARVYASFQLDKLFTRIAQALKSEPWVRPSTGAGTGTVIMATELAAAGGHVEVIKDLVRAGGIAQPVHLLLTNNFNRIDPKAQADYAASINIPLTIAQGVTTVERLHSLNDFLQIHRPHALVLLVHNQDALGIATALLGHADEMLFVHHGDHHLSLGVTCPQFVHIDVSNHCFFHCRHKLGLTDNILWPLTLSNEKASTRHGPFMAAGHAITCAAGRPEKFDDASYHYQYFDLIALILASSGGRHIHIGQLSESQLARIHEGLRKHQVNQDRFTHIPWVPSVAKALIENNVDVYLTSFPYGGAKSQIEATATGMPILIHRNYRSQFLSGVDFAYPGVMTWANEADLCSILQNLTPELLEEHSAKALHHFKKYHSEDAFVAAVSAKHTHISSVPPLAIVYDDGLQAFLDEEVGINGRSVQGEIARLNGMLRHQISEAERLHSLLAMKNDQISRMGTRRNMLKTLLSGRRLKP